MLKKCNYSVGLRTCCADRNKAQVWRQKTIGEADLEWIFARNCEGTEQLRKNEICGGFLLRY